QATLALVTNDSVWSWGATRVSRSFTSVSLALIRRSRSSCAARSHAVATALVLGTLLTSWVAGPLMSVLMASIAACRLASVREAQAILGFGRGSVDAANATRELFRVPMTRGLATASDSRKRRIERIGDGMV